MSIISDNDFVRLYQGRHGLKIDGVAGGKTIAQLGVSAPSRLPLDDDAFVRLFQTVHALTVDGWAGRDTIATLDLISPAPLAAADIPPSYWPMLSKIESGDRPYIKAASSSASGLYQFIKKSWLAEGGKWGADMTKAFGGLTPSPDEQLARAKTFTAKNAVYLRGKRIPINRASLYAAHFFGALTAAAVIGADAGARADLIAGPAATKANPSILQDKTVGQFIVWLKGKTGELAR